MPVLLLTRHAKSSWDHPSLDDFDRPLNARGERDAPRMALHLRQQGLVPTQIISSTACRARQTTALLAGGLGINGDRISFDDALYLADPIEIRHSIACSACDEVVMVVAHNPGITMLVEQLSGEDIGNLPTCGVAVLTVNLVAWADIIDDTSASLQAVYRPKLIA